MKISAIGEVAIYQKKEYSKIDYTYNDISHALKKLKELFKNEGYKQTNEYINPMPFPGGNNCCSF